MRFTERRTALANANHRRPDRLPGSASFDNGHGCGLALSDSFGDSHHIGLTAVAGPPAEQVAIRSERTC